MQIQSTKAGYTEFAAKEKLDGEQPESSTRRQSVYSDRDGRDGKRRRISRQQTYQLFSLLTGHRDFSKRTPSCPQAQCCGMGRIELALELEENIPEEIGLAVQELVEEVVRLQLRVADLVRFIESEGDQLE